MTVLTTDRLRLAPPAAEDWPIYAAHHGDTAAEAWDTFTGDIGHWVVRGFGWFIVRRGDAVVGSVGLHHPKAHAEVELAWNSFEGHEGQGYATEAARAVLAWGDGVLSGADQAARIVSYIDVDNTPSQRVAEKLGAARTRDRATHDPACEIWVHHRGAA